MIISTPYSIALTTDKAELFFLKNPIRRFPEDEAAPNGQAPTYAVKRWAAFSAT